MRPDTVLLRPQLNMETVKTCAALPRPPKVKQRTYLQQYRVSGTHLQSSSNQ